MGKILTDEEFALKFNLQKWLKMEIEDEDAVRISQALNFDLAMVQKILKEFEENGSQSAS